jgi:hypothetical protein
MPNPLNLIGKRYGRLLVVGLGTPSPSHSGGPTVSCMQGWFRGDTKRPQSASLEAAGRAVGFKRVWRKM